MSGVGIELLGMISCVYIWGKSQTLKFDTAFFRSRITVGTKPFTLLHIKIHTRVADPVGSGPFLLDPDIFHRIRILSWQYKVK